MQIDGIYSTGSNCRAHGEKQINFEKTAQICSFERLHVKPDHVHVALDDDDRGRGCSGRSLYTDFSKAFDSVPHQCLMKKMSDIGTTENTLTWIK